MNYHYTNRLNASMKLIDRVRAGNYYVHPEVLNALPRLGDTKLIAEALARTVPVTVQNVYEWMIDDWFPNMPPVTQDCPMGRKHFGELRPSFESAWFEWRPRGLLRRAVWAANYDNRWLMFLIEEVGFAACITHHWVVDLEREPLEFGYPTNLTLDDKAFLTDASELVLLTQSLMLCKNVQVVERRTSSLPKRLPRKRGRRSPTNYRSVVIEPMKKVIKNAGGFQKLGSERVMHIVRGHFRDYSEERPLFGKFSGRLFVHQHVRGNSKVGVKQPGYEVRSPKKDPEAA